MAHTLGTYYALDSPHPLILNLYNILSMPRSESVDCALLSGVKNQSDMHRP